MRDSGVIEVRVRRFVVWRSAVAVVAVAAIAALAAWARATAANHDDAPWLPIAVASLLGAATVACAVSLARVRAGVLARRAGAWSFTAEGGTSVAGPLTVALDLGSFLLLRLHASRRRSTWLPVERRGLEREWHALRCAVYAPTPPPGAAAAGLGPPPR